MKTYAEVDGAWQELLPADVSRTSDTNRTQSAVIELANIDESPDSTG